MHRRVFDLTEFADLKGDYRATDYDGVGELGDLTAWVFSIISNHYFGKKVKIQITRTSDDARPPFERFKKMRIEDIKPMTTDEIKALLQSPIWSDE